MFEPIQKRSLADEVYEQLADQILSRRIEPGVSLPSERELCEQLGVSRTIIREALRRLEQARLISTSQGSRSEVLDFGTHAGLEILTNLIVRHGEIDYRAVRSVIEMRIVLGPEIARLCAERGTQEQHDRLWEILDEWAELETPTPEQIEALNLQIWSLLVEGSDNIAYQLAYNSLRETYEKFQVALRGVFLAEMTNAFELYDDMRRAILDRNGEKAANLARQALEVGTGRMLEILIPLIDSQPRR